MLILPRIKDAERDENMFFTNGRVPGGTPIWLLLGIIYVALILDELSGGQNQLVLVLNS